MEIVSSVNTLHLICKAPFGEVGTYFAVVEDVYLFIGCDSMKALKVMYMLHYIFDIQYDTTLNKFYNFFDTYLFKIKKINSMISVEHFIEKI